jgi:hypothetical protein
MMRRLITYALLTGTLLLCGLAATGPVDVAGAALAPPGVSRTVMPGHGFDLHLGDGIFRLRIRGCDSCRTAVTIELRLPRLGHPASCIVNPGARATYYRVRSHSA